MLFTNGNFLILHAENLFYQFERYFPVNIHTLVHCGIYMESACEGLQIHQLCEAH